MNNNNYNQIIDLFSRHLIITVLTGLISIGDWVNIMTKIMNMDLPWRQLKKYLFPDDSSSYNIPYTLMIEHLEKQYQYQVLSISTIYIYIIICIHYILN